MRLIAEHLVDERARPLCIEPAPVSGHGSADATARLTGCGSKKSAERALRSAGRPGFGTARGPAGWPWGQAERSSGGLNGPLGCGETLARAFVPPFGVG